MSLCGKSRASPLPTIVVEGGCSESLDSLHQKACIDIGSAGSPVRVVIAIRLCKPTPDEGDANVQQYPEDSKTVSCQRCRRLYALINIRSMCGYPARANSVQITP